MLFIGIDLGTSSVKLLLVDEYGRHVKSVTCSYPQYFPCPGWSEQNPKEWLEATMEGLRKLLQGQNKHLVKGISFCGQMHGLIVLDENDRVIRPAILWNDGRSEVETNYLNQSIGEDLLIKETGNVAFSGFTAPKLLWLKKNEPQTFSKIHKIFLPKDYLTFYFTGEFVSDYSDVSGTLLFNVRKQKWSSTMLDICELKQSFLPEVFKGSDPVGYIRPEIALDLGLSADVRVMAGAGDNAAAAVGTGTIGEGKGNISIGTSGTVFVSVDEYQPLTNHAIHQFCHTDGSYHLLGCMLSAASCVQWWSNEIQNGQNDIDINRRQSTSSVFFLPYLMGERSPHNDERIRGAFIGLSLDTTASDMFYAVHEGVAFGLCDSVEIIRTLGISLQSFTATGGGTINRKWMELLSNVIRARIYLFEEERGAAYGAAILAAVGVGVWPSIKDAVQKLESKTISFCPDDLDSKLYHEKYKRFVRLYPLVRQFYL